MWNRIKQKLLTSTDARIMTMYPRVPVEYLVRINVSVGGLMQEGEPMMIVMA